MSTDDQPLELPEAPELVGRDKHKRGGNVRPADDRFLTEKQIERRDAYLAEVAELEAEAAVTDPPDEDPVGDLLQGIADSVHTDPEPEKEANDG